MFKNLRCTNGILSRSAFLLILTAFLAVSTDAFAVDTHGFGISKSCTGPVRTCDSDADCGATGNECTENFCNLSIPNTTECFYKATYTDDFGDTLTIVGAFDTVKADAGDIRQPAAGFEVVYDVEGNTSCVIGGSLPCTIGPDIGDGIGIVTFRSAGFNPPVGETSPVPDTAQLDWRDGCNGTADPNCLNIQPPQTINGQTTLVLGCEERNKSDSTPCTDTGEECWNAGCESGVCVQQHVPVTPSTPCSEVSGTECADPGCDGSGTCVADHIPKTDSTPCTDTGEECWDAGCESGVCVQQHVPKSASTPCGDTGEECFDAGCDGAGSCDQQHIPLQCGDEICRTPGFWGARGGTEKAPKSTNITQAVIDSVTPPGLEVCGTFITNTDLLSNQSAIEAICVHVKGDSKRQLVRQLTAAALNCALAPCSAEHATLVSDCNTICANEVVGEYTDCIGDLDYFNNGGGGEGYCDIGGEPCSDSEPCVGTGDFCQPTESCHDRDLCPDWTDNGELDGSDFCFEPPGPASSPKKCNAARKNSTFVAPSSP